MLALPTALVGSKELPEHLMSGQGWFSLVPATCSRSSGVTDGSIYCVAVTSPANFTLIWAQQCKTIPPIHKTLGFLLFWVAVIRFMLMNVLVVLWKITWWHGVRDRKANPFFFSLQFSPKLDVNYVLQLLMKCWGCWHFLLTQQKEQSPSFSKK